MYLMSKKCRKRRQNKAAAPNVVEMPAVMVNAVQYNPRAQQGYHHGSMYGPPGGNQYPTAVPHYPAQRPNA